MPKFKIRFFFDAGSGICLWATDVATKHAFDYAIDIRTLPLSENIRYQATYLIAWFDTRIDWDEPTGHSKWDKDETNRFNTAAQNLLIEFRKELGDDFEIEDKSGTTTDA